MTHTPVYLTEAIQALEIRAGGRYIDATLGEGGHYEAIAGHDVEVVGLDWDASQIEAMRLRFPGGTFRHTSFAHLSDVVHSMGWEQVDGVLFDLGLSYGQLKKGGIGLSFKNSEEPLDMRLSADAEYTAADILNRYNEQELYEMFARGSEDINSQAMAAACVQTRNHHKFECVGDFMMVIDTTITKNPQVSYARLFQALRIEVNDEMGALRAGLEQALDVVAPGGHVVVITFHSLEDRIVKRFAQSHTSVIEKSSKVTKKNPSKYERSAIVRVMTKK